MKIQWLGTAAAEGWPALWCRCPYCLEAQRRGGRNLRMRSGALIDDILLIDPNPDLYGQKLRFNLDLGLVRDVLVTHNHEDHLQVINPQIYASPFAYGMAAKRLPMYGPEDAMAMVRPFSCVETHSIEAGDVFDTAMHHVTVLPALHSAKNGKFFLIERDGHSILYAHDTDLFIPEAMEILRRAVKNPIDIVSLDCTNGPLPHSYIGHMGLAENVQTRDILVKEGLADKHTLFVCNHFSHNGGMLHEELCEWGKQNGFEIAYDGMIATTAPNRTSTALMG